MPLSVTVELGNLKENRRGRNYEIAYFGPKEDIDGWKFYEPPLGHTIWYREATREPRVSLTYKMPKSLAFIPENYRIEVFIPPTHATVREARFAVTESVDQRGNPLEVIVTKNMLKAEGEWVSLGEFRLNIGEHPSIGQVRQFDSTAEELVTKNGNKREITFGPVRWVPLYQTVDPVYTEFADVPDMQGTNIRVNYLVDSEQEKLVRQQWSRGKFPDFMDTRREQVIWFRRRSKTRRLRVDYNMPANVQAGLYRIEVFIPAILTSAKKVVYTVKTGMSKVFGQKKFDEQEILIDQSMFRNQWAILGEFELTPDPNPDPFTGSLVGQVSQHDDSEDNFNLFMSFGPVRWVPRFKQELKPSKQFDIPVGPVQDRHAPIKTERIDTSWLRDWFDASPYLEPYPLGVHTGADLNLRGANDRDAPIFAAGDGIVTFAGEISWGTWGNVIVIEHPVAWVTTADGVVVQQKVYTRYGHVSPESFNLVQAGKHVLRGENIGFIGLMRGFNDNEHLHFDVSHTEILKDSPGHWPNMSELVKLMPEKNSKPKEFQRALKKVQKLVSEDYLDPLQFLIDNHNRFTVPA